MPMPSTMADSNDAAPLDSFDGHLSSLRVETLTPRLDNRSTDHEIAIAQAIAAGATWAEIAQSLSGVEGPKARRGAGRRAPGIRSS